MYDHIPKWRWINRRPWQMTRNVRGVGFRAKMYEVMDCCWQCETITLAVVYPAHPDIELDLDEFLTWCISAGINPDHFRPEPDQPTLQWLLEHVRVLRGYAANEAQGDRDGDL